MLNKKCICLFSGGLDSVLAIKVMQEQGVECIPINFRSPFFCAKKTNKPEIYSLDIPIYTEDVSEEFMKVLRDPAHGYGSVVNPCIDCKILIMKTAKSLLSKYGASFIVSGEVLGQRPMSQQRQSMALIAKAADVTDILLRPLSAKLLEPTLPEVEGIVDRSKLLDISGRSRKSQLALVKKFNITEFSQPAGGCILTEPQFEPRINDYLQNNKTEDYTQLRLLSVGRHFRYGSAKIIVGRNEYENNFITSLCKSGQVLVTPTDVMGPTAIICDNDINSDCINFTSRVVMFYADCDTPTCDITVTNGSDSQQITVKKIEKNDFLQYMLVK